MRSSVTSSVLLVGLVAGLAGVYGCDSGTSRNNSFPTGTAGTTGNAGATGASGTTGNAGATGASGTTGNAGATGASGTTGAAGDGASGTTGTAGTGSAAGTTGTAGTGAAAGTTGTAGTGAAGTGAAGTGTTAGTGPFGDITKVVPTTGCGMAPGATGMQTIQTSGVKDANCADHLNGVAKCGAWSVQRTYYINLPGGYDNTKAYPLVFEGPGCGGGGNNLYNNPALAAMVIRIGMSPPPNSVGHGTNENQGCFDDKEGDDSVDWPFYTAVWDKLASTLCFDKNRVFAGGNSSGAWFSNEVGCKFAGDAVHPIRGIMPNTGGLPDQPMYKPTCTMKGMAGMWVHGIGDTTNPFTGNIYAMNRAITVNGCPAGMTYANAMFDPFPLGGDTTSCKRYKGCSPLFPLVVCPLNLNDHASHDNVVNPGWVAFIKLFQAAPLFTP